MLRWCIQEPRSVRLGEISNQSLRVAQELGITMPSNIEIKARVKNPERLRSMAEEESGTLGELIEQDDTFFRVPQGRLKLRVLSSNRGELIFYERKDEAGPKQSHYFISETDDPSGLKKVLESALGVLGVVRKQRTLLLAGQTRIHIDEVEGLGSFMELEVVMQPAQSVEEGSRIAAELMERLDIHERDLVEGAYLDLILARKQDQ